MSPPLLPPPQKGRSGVSGCRTAGPHGTQHPSAPRGEAWGSTSCELPRSPCALSLTRPRPSVCPIRLSVPSFPSLAVSFPRSSASPFVPPWPPPGVSIPVPGCSSPVPLSWRFLSVCPLLIPLSLPSRVPPSVCPPLAVPASPCPLLLCTAGFCSVPLSPADPHPHLWVSPPPPQPPMSPSVPVLPPVLVWVSHSGTGWALVTLSRAVPNRAAPCRRGGLSRARPARPLPPPAPGGGGAVTGAVPGPARAEPSGAGPRRAEPCGTGSNRAGPRSPMNGIAFCLVGIPPPAVSRAGRCPPDGGGEGGNGDREGGRAAAPWTMLTPRAHGMGRTVAPGPSVGGCEGGTASPPRALTACCGWGRTGRPWGGDGDGDTAVGGGGGGRGGRTGVGRVGPSAQQRLRPRVLTQSCVRLHPSVPGCRDSASPAPQWGNDRPRRINCRAKRLRNEQSCSSQRLGVNRGFPSDSSALTPWG